MALRLVYVCATSLVPTYLPHSDWTKVEKETPSAATEQFKYVCLSVESIM